MNFNPNEIRRLKENKGIIRRNNNSLDRLKKDISTSNGNVNARIQSLTAKSIESVSKSLEELRKQKMDIVFIFDKSSSCHGTEHDTIMGFYDILQKEKSNGYNDFITTVLFDNNIRIVHDRNHISENLSLNYIADGAATSLYDAIFFTINQIQNKQQNQKVKTLVVIMTDGYDNNSRHNLLETRELITKKTYEDWQFIFLGAMIDSKEIARELGIPMNNAEDYSITQIENNFKAIQKALESLRETGKIEPDWSKPITENRHTLNGRTGYVKRLGTGN